jgi:DNA gyrase subunit A
MAKKNYGNEADGELFDTAGKSIINTTLQDEVEKSFLEYSYSVITSRALPDARDGLKPVHRRILFAMHEAGLVPGHAFVKSARVVGNTMGQYHPHGDSAIYDAMVRLAQDFSLNTPFVDGHGNFGSPNDGPAASRYCVTGDTKVRLAGGGNIAIDEIVSKSELDTEYEIDLEVIDKDNNPVHASKFFNSGLHPIKKVELNNGLSLRGSHNHLILTLQAPMGVPIFQWMQLDELKEGMPIALLPNKEHSVQIEEKVVPFISEYLNSTSDEESTNVVKSILDSGYEYQTVSRISDEEPQIVYSIRVDSEDHSFLAGGFINHNTEARLAKPAMLLVEGLDEETVDMSPNYDGSILEPSVLPAAFPNLLVNGSSGIAVGMATNMIPHNLNEAVSAARLLIKNPEATLKDLMKVIPGPDLPTGGVLLGLDEVEKAYADGKGSVRIRAKGTIEPLEGSRGRMSIVFTELPYSVGSERIIEKIKDEINKKRLQGIADVKDLSDRRHGIRLVIECKTGVNPTALLSDLYRYTPLEVSFGISNLALVEGNPKTLGLKEMLTVFLDHRYNVVTRRTEYRLRKAEARKHIVEGLLIALVAIDEVVKVIKASRDTQEARTNLMSKFILTDIQAGHILDLPLRRLVSLEVEALKVELEELKIKIASLKDILDNREVLEKLVDEELALINKNFPSPRRTELVGGELKELIAAEQSASVPLDIPNEAVEIFLTASGMVGKIVPQNDSAELKPKRGRQKHDIITHAISANSHDKVLVITNLGNATRVPVIEIPTISPQLGSLTVKAGIPARELITLEKGETVIAIAPASHETALGIAMATYQGTVKIVNFDFPLRSDKFDVIALKDSDTLISATLAFEEDEFILISSDTSLLHFPAKLVRAQGRSGGGVAGMGLAADTKLVSFGVVSPKDVDPMVITYTGETVKVTPLSAYPGKGRGTGGVRSHKFLKEESKLVSAWVGVQPIASNAKGEPVALPNIDSRRDGSGSKADGIIEQIGSNISINN